MKNHIHVFSVNFRTSDILQKLLESILVMLFVPSFQSKNRKWCFLGIHPNFSQSNGWNIELSIWVRTLLKFKFLLQPGDPRTTSLTGTRFSKFCWSWSGPRLDFFLGPVPGLELYPGPSWSLNIYGLGPALEFLILSGTRTAPVLVGGSLLQLLDFGQDLLNFPLLHLTSQCLQLQQK